LLGKSSIPAVIQKPAQSVKGFWWNIGIKTLIFIGFIYVLNQQLQGKDIWEMMHLFYLQVQEAPLIYLGLAIALMPFNWWCEAEKWGVLMKRVEVLSLLDRLKSVAAGVTFSIFTPNRIGEYGGRILFVKPENNWKAIIATVVGSYSQWVVLLMGGLLGAIAFSQFFLQASVPIQRGLYILSWLLVGAMLIGYFNLDLIVQLLQKLPRWRFMENIRKQLDMMQLYQRKELELALVLALSRYLIYSLQYYFLLRFFGVEVGLITGLSGIATIYLVQTSIPLPPFMGLIMRGEIALYVWGLLGAPAMSILAATFCLWALNIIVPALVGMVFIADINIIKSLGYDRTKESRSGPTQHGFDESIDSNAAKLAR